MKARALAFAVALIVAASSTRFGQTTTQPTSSGYLTPPKIIMDMLDATPTPAVLVSPDHQVIALLDRRSMPTIADLAEPIHRIAGARINPKTNGRQQRTGRVFAITLKSIADGAEKKVSVPPAAHRPRVRHYSEVDRRWSRKEGKRSAKREHRQRRVLPRRQATLVHQH